MDKPPDRAAGGRSDGGIRIQWDTIVIYFPRRVLVRVQRSPRGRDYLYKIVGAGIGRRTWALTRPVSRRVVQFGT